MVDVRGDALRPPHGTTPAAVKSSIKSEMSSFKSNENIHRKEGGSYYVVSGILALHFILSGFSCPLKNQLGGGQVFQSLNLEACQNYFSVVAFLKLSELLTKVSF